MLARVDVITIFPDLVERFLTESLVGQARERGILALEAHDLRDFASDDIELKLVSRDMMRMTEEINEKWFPDSETEVVTCFTCHQGQRIPALDEAAAGLLLPQD